MDSPLLPSAGACTEVFEVALAYLRTKTIRAHKNAPFFLPSTKGAYDDEGVADVALHFSAARRREQIGAVA
jgi:hypothetical protein